MVGTHTWLLVLMSVCSWVTYITPPFLSFQICKMGILQVFTLQDPYED